MTGARIVVLGAGPAGAAAACGLARLGYDVTVVSGTRHFRVIEGISRRVLDGLRHAGLIHAAACATGPYARTARWNGVTQTANTEWLLDRERFDLALRADLAAARVTMLPGIVRALDAGASGHRIVVGTGNGLQQTLHADFLVEARGRQAPRPCDALRGPQTVSLIHVWQGMASTPGAAVESFEHGWFWMARMPDGLCYWQVNLDTGNIDLPQRRHLPDFCQHLRQTPLARAVFGDKNSPQAITFARSSSTMLAQETGGANWLRVGDAAMTADPLSGNGTFQSLSSSLQAPAVIHTLLTGPERAALSSIAHRATFLRFTRTGRDFYALEQQWPATPFWRVRRAWPDQQPVHTPASFKALKVETAPVIDGNLIAQARVVTSPDQPLGVWYLQGIELAPVITALQQQPAAHVLATLPPRTAALVREWLQTQGCADVLAT